MRTDVQVPMRITVLRPLPGVTLKLQRGRSDLISPTREAPEAISFDFNLRLGEPAVGGRPRWLGEFAQGTPDDRFVYINAGQRAGQASTAWDRRAKVKLASITPEQVRAVLDAPGQVLEARFEGVGRDGGPACATVRLLDRGWRIVGAAT